MTLAFKAEGLHFTSDTHFFHRAMLGADRRNFATVEEMNSALIVNWNSVVSPADTVFHLGDLSFGGAHDTVGILWALNGNIVLIEGNHDKKLKALVRDRFKAVHPFLEIDVVEGGGTKQRISLMHYAMRTWNRHHFGAWQLHGHSHGNLEPIGRQMDVGVDANLLQPVSYESVKARLSHTPIHIVDHHDRSTKE